MIHAYPCPQAAFHLLRAHDRHPTGGSGRAGRGCLPVRRALDAALPSTEADVGVFAMDAMPDDAARELWRVEVDIEAP